MLEDRDADDLGDFFGDVESDPVCEGVREADSDFDDDLEREEVTDAGADGECDAVAVSDLVWLPVTLMLAVTEMVGVRDGVTEMVGVRDGVTEMVGVRDGVTEMVGDALGVMDTAHPTNTGMGSIASRGRDTPIALLSLPSNATCGKPEVENPVHADFRPFTSPIVIRLGLPGHNLLSSVAFAETDVSNMNACAEPEIHGRSRWSTCLKLYYSETECMQEPAQTRIIQQDTSSNPGGLHQLKVHTHLCEVSSQLHAGQVHGELAGGRITGPGADLAENYAAC